MPYLSPNPTTPIFTPQFPVPTRHPPTVIPNSSPQQPSSAVELYCPFLLFRIEITRTPPLLSISSNFWLQTWKGIVLQNSSSLPPKLCINVYFTCWFYYVTVQVWLTRWICGWITSPHAVDYQYAFGVWRQLKLSSPGMTYPGMTYIHIHDTSSCHRPRQITHDYRAWLGQISAGGGEGRNPHGLHLSGWPEFNKPSFSGHTSCRKQKVATNSSEHFTAGRYKMSHPAGDLKF